VIDQRSPASIFRRARPRRWLLRGSAATLALAAGACTQPQSGIQAKGWCVAAGIVDDMEDGDGVPCRGAQSWTVDTNSASTTPGAGSINEMPFLDVPREMETGTASYRALGLAGSGFAAAATTPWAVLTVPFPTQNINTFESIRFFFRSDGSLRTVDGLRRLQLRVGVITAATAQEPATCDGTYQDHWGDTVVLEPDLWLMVDVPISSLKQQECGGPARPDRAADLADSRGLEFRYAPFFPGAPGVQGTPNQGEGQFRFLIDDVQFR
jgi:hypothetical protein